MNKNLSSPIFIGGDGRSGTTLLSVILNAHPELSVGPELHFSGPKNLGMYVRDCASLLLNNDNRAFGKGLKSNPELKLGVQFVKRGHRMGIEFDEMIKLVDNLTSKYSLESFDERCLLIDSIGKHICKKFNTSRWGIKIMREIKKCQNYSLIWPSAQFIHIIRDGRDVAASQMTDHGRWGYEDLLTAAKSWKELILDTRKNSKHLSYLEIRYEDLVFNTKSTLDTVCEFLGCGFDNSMLNHEISKNPIFENPYNHPSAKQIIKPISDSAIGRYKKDLTKEQIISFNEEASDLLNELKYNQ